MLLKFVRAIADIIAKKYSSFDFGVKYNLGFYLKKIFFTLQYSTEICEVHY